MNTMAKEAPNRRRRGIHSEEFKASVVLASQQPGVSMASVALANELLAINRESFMKLVKSNPLFGFELLKGFAERLRYINALRT